MEGTSPASFINIPAIIIIMVGTGGATMASVGMAGMKRVPSLYKLVFSAEPPDLDGRVELLVSLAEQARREGLLALDAQVGEIEDDFTRKGLQLVVDGIDPDLVRDILEAEIDGMMARHAAGAAPFEKAGGFAPTMGIIGTVMGLVHVLQNLAAPATLGPSISAAFIATLMGVGAANVVFLPVGQSAEGAVLRGGRAAHADARRDPLRPGRRQPAGRRRQADLVRTADRSCRSGRRGQRGADADSERRPSRCPRALASGAAAAVTTRPTRTTSGGCSPTRT